MSTAHPFWNLNDIGYTSFGQLVNTTYLPRLLAIAVSTVTRRNKDIAYLAKAYVGLVAIRPSPF